jgi:ABC-2 type transport system ATP-binding protein
MMHAPPASPSRTHTTAAQPAPDDTAIDVRDLTRSFRKRKGWLRSGELVEAVRGISFAVPQGTIFGVLGPNGAGKTTTIKMLSTLLLPSSGTATINGFDIVRDEHRVRTQLGVLFGGDKGLYNQLNAWENLRYFGRLYGMSDTLIEQRGHEMLERVQLHDRASERVESYSRGMKQRLHIAKTLIHNPPIVILDEPTIGLDPGAAIGVRELIADLVPDHTVLLTTHDMHEADTLCRELAIVDRGLIVAAGTPAALKSATEIDRRIVLSLDSIADGELERMTHGLLAHDTIVSTSHQPGDTGLTVLDLVCTDTTSALDATLALLRERGASVQAIDIREPSLEDAFLRATGREFEGDTAPGNDDAISPSS